MPSYATLQDVYDLGFTARAFVVVPRPWQPEKRMGDAIDITTGTIRMAGHGYSASDLVEFVLYGAGSVPAGASDGVLYSPVPVDFFRFRLALNGTTLTYTAPGSGWALQIDPERRLQRHLDDAATRIDRALIAQSPPLKPDPITGKYPAEVVGINARIAARSAIPSLQFENPAHRSAADRVLAQEAADERMLADWMAGKPLLPEALDQDGVANDAMRATNRDTATRRPCINWQRGTL
jgi:hypothetical protein